MNKAQSDKLKEILGLAIILLEREIESRQLWYNRHNLNYKHKDEIAEDLLRVSDETGYDYEFLCDVWNEKIMDGDTPEEAMEHVAAVSYEKDW